MNVLKTYFLLLGLTALLTGFGWVLDRFMGTGGLMMMIFFTLGLVMNWIAERVSPPPVPARAW